MLDAAKDAVDEAVSAVGFYFDVAADDIVFDAADVAVVDADVCDAAAVVGDNPAAAVSDNGVGDAVDAAADGGDAAVACCDDEVAVDVPEFSMKRVVEG